MKAIIIAPAKRVEKKPIYEFLNYCKECSIDCTVSENTFSDNGYFSGTNEERFLDLQKAVNDETLDIIFCARGGYGTSQLLDDLNLNKLEKKPKTIIGFSDTTVLLNHLNNYGVESIHGSVPGLFDVNKHKKVQSFESVFKILKGEDYSLSAIHKKNNVTGVSEGKVVGGNLTMICHSLATVSEIDTNDNILLIEEIDEYLYEVDRMLLQLKRANKLSKIAGLALGYFSHIKDGRTPFGSTLEEIILNYVPKDIPIAFGFPFGHEDLNMPFIVGRKAKLTVNKEQSTLQYL